MGFRVMSSRRLGMFSRKQVEVLHRQKSVSVSMFALSKTLAERLTEIDGVLSRKSSCCFACQWTMTCLESSLILG